MSYFPQSYFGAPYFPAAYFAKVTLVSTRAVRVILPARFADPDYRPVLRKNPRVVEDGERLPYDNIARAKTKGVARYRVWNQKRTLFTQQWRESFGGYLR